MKPDIAKAITKLNNKNDNEFTTIMYGRNGKIVTEKDKACAIEISGGNRFIFKVMVDEDGRLFNPQKKRTNKKITKELLNFRQVNSVCFHNYLEFLTKKFESLLNIAERNR